jgi:hypothetical protein
MTFKQFKTIFESFREENKGISRVNHVGEFTSKSLVELCCNQN